MESQFYFECVHRYMKYKTFHEDLPKNQHDTIRKAARHFLETGMYCTMKILLHYCTQYCMMKELLILS